MEHWGYIALVIGCVLEGESTLIAGGFMTHRGLFNLPLTITLFVLTTMILDWTYFFISRSQGQKFLSRHPRFEKKVTSITKRIEKYPILIMTFYRFLYGIRIPILIAFGLSSYHTRRFLIYSFIGTCLWVTVYLALGYHFGVMIENQFEKVKTYEWEIAGALFVILVCIFFFLQRRNSKKLMEAQ